jgi:hypothetical protein
MSKLLSVVADNERDAEPSPSRQSLVRAQARRADAQAAFEEVMRQHRRIECLIDGKKAALDARIAELEREHEEILTAWALRQGAQQDAEPELPHLDEIDALKKQSRQAEMKERSARAALAKMNDEMVVAQQCSAEAIAAIRSAANAVLLDVAAGMAEELQRSERRSAALRGYIKALARHFELEGHRRNPGGELAGGVVQMLPRGPFELSEPGLKEAAERWRALADRLMTNVNAEMELPA